LTFQGRSKTRDRTVAGGTEDQDLDGSASRMPVRNPADGRPLHRESLLRIPLLAQLLNDPGFSIIRRAIDSRWKYEGMIATRVDGFNPFRGAAFVGTHSYFDRWLPLGAPLQSRR